MWKIFAQDALMVPNPRENSRGGRVSRESSGRRANVENISPRISARSNTGETSGSRPLQRQKDASMVPNPRETSRGGRASREISGRRADVQSISPRIVLYDRILERPPVVVWYSPKTMPW